MIFEYTYFERQMWNADKITVTKLPINMAILFASFQPFSPNLC